MPASGLTIETGEAVLAVETVYWEKFSQGTKTRRRNNRTAISRSMASTSLLPEMEQLLGNEL